MRILIDTNILIHLEDNKVVDDSFYKFYQLAITNQCEILYHPHCLRDLSKDSNKERKQIISSKLAKYTPIDNPAVLDRNFSINLGEKKENDKIDNSQLFQLYKEYVELLVTNDKGIHKKAKQLGLGQKVLTSQQAYVLLDKRYTLKIPTHPVLEHISVRNLEEDFESNFFVSLKNDYDPVKFMEWIKRCAQENRKCYRLKTEGNLSALLIYNVEKVQDHKLNDISEDVIKICTLKVGDDALGLKLGELFINLMFQLAVHQKLNYVYITTYDKQQALINLLDKFGFIKFDEFENNVGINENIYLKFLKKEQQKNVDGIALHPFFRLNQNKFVIPIQQEYYKSLFKDGNLREPTLFDSEDYGLEEIQGNTIVKAYISNSQITTLNPGDLLFFYSSKNYKSIEPVGILIEHRRISDFDELWNLVKSKTVYEQSDLKKWLDDRKKLTVTIFRLAQYLKPVISFNEIKKMKSYAGKFQTITKLSEEDFNLIIKDRIDESFVVH